jgi:hypothetical protein
MGENLVWFGEIERKLAKSSYSTFTYRSSSYLFYDSPRRILSLKLQSCYGARYRFQETSLDLSSQAT